MRISDWSSDVCSSDLVGGEEDGVAELNGGALSVLRERDDVALGAAERGPVAHRVLDQLVGLGDPERPAAALEPVVEDDAGDLAALAPPGAVAQEPNAPAAQGVPGSMGRPACRDQVCQSVKI